MGKLFGDYIRKKREALRRDNPEYSIRKVAKRMGIHHSYLSKVERGEPAALTEKRIAALAEELGEDSELLLAMSGKVSEDTRRAIFKSPDFFSRLVRHAKSEVVPDSLMVNDELAVLRSLRDMSVMHLDTEFRVLSVQSDFFGATGIEGRKCHEALFERDSPCPECPAVLSSISRTSQVKEIMGFKGETWLVGSTPLVVGDSVSDGFINVGIDISRGRELERSRSEIEGLMFHDIRSPLSGIIGMARSLQEDENLTREQVTCLAVLARSSEQLMDQVSRSMDIHLMESGRLDYMPVKVDVAALIRDLGQRVTLEDQFAGIDLELRIDGRPLMDHDTVWVLANEVMAARMLRNLVVNAFEASVKGDVVRLVINVRESVSISIKNRECIPDSIMSQFFKKYISSGKRGGLGLGVYGAKLMAELMGGDISMDSHEELGTVIKVSLPR